MRNGIAAQRMDEYGAWKDSVFDRIQQILEEDWDPIELYQKVWIPGDAPDNYDGEKTDADWPRGEYECYEQALFWMISAGFNRYEVAKLLNHLASDCIGEPNSEEQNLIVADKLLAIEIIRDWT